LERQSAPRTRVVVSGSCLPSVLETGNEDKKFSYTCKSSSLLRAVGFAIEA
jgi:hypothetical protein